MMAKAPDIIPKEALAWLKSKKLTPGFDYRDVWKQEHSIGFTVAKMTQLDLLSDVKRWLMTRWPAASRSPSSGRC
jgi:uncharacterized protein with gpF-like domain